MNYLFTSESVSEGHPDKVSDQISDAILDNMLAQDPQAHVACETLCTTGQVVIAGEVSCNGWVDIQQIARKTIKSIGVVERRGPMTMYALQTCAIRLRCSSWLTTISSPGASTCSCS